MTALWHFGEVAQAVGAHNTHEGTIYGISIDSRAVKEGDLFIALAGDNFDGHNYVKAALKNGAAAAIIHKECAHIDSARLFWVEDTQKALYDLAKAARLRSKARIAAITGSVGKTGLKEALAHILEGQGNIHYTQGNLNNHLGLPLSLARMPKDTDFGLFEIGMNHSGEITPLVQLLKPHVAAITAIANAHSEFFASTKEIAKAKAEIFLGFSGEGRVLLPGDDEHYDDLLHYARHADISVITSFGTNTLHDYAARHIETHGHGSHFDAYIRSGNSSQIYKAKTAAWGHHYVLNAIAALGLVHLLGGDLEKAVSRLADFSNPQGRGQIIKACYGDISFTLIDDAYNANEESMKASLSLFHHSQTPPQKRYAILGEMLELGENSPAAHLALAESIKQAELEKLWLIGKAMQPLYAHLKDSMNVVYEESIAPIINHPESLIAADIWLLAKGSHGSQIHKIVDKLKG